MKIYTVTDGTGWVVAAGTDAADLKAKAQKDFEGCSSQFEWRQEWNGQERLYYRVDSTGRWNKIPSRFLQTVEVDATFPDCTYDCSVCHAHEEEEE